MTTKAYFLTLILVSGLIEFAADVLFKKWASENQYIFIILGVILYTIGTIAWAFSLKYEYLSKAAVIFNILNLTLALIAGHVFFEESLNFLAKVGVFLGIVSIVLLQY